MQPLPSYETNALTDLGLHPLSMISADLPSWLPAGASTIQEGAAQVALRQMQRYAVHVPLMQRTLQTAYLKTPAAAAASGARPSRM